MQVPPIGSDSYKEHSVEQKEKELYKIGKHQLSGPSTKEEGINIEKAISGMTTEQKPSIKDSSYKIEGNRRAGKENIEIIITIANCSNLELNESNLGKIFGLANQYTLNTQYPIENTSRIYPGTDIVVHRPNHNGTHSARQVRFLEALFDLIENKGKPEIKELLNSLSQEEKLNLKLAAYFLRAGRVDESSHKNPPADDFNSRSAQIYDEYAKQLGVSENTRNWIKPIIIDSCKPISICSEEIKSNSRSNLGYQLATIAHELDLVRCFDKNHMIGNMKGTEERLGSLLTEGADTAVKTLYEYANTLCKVTGSKIRASDVEVIPELFAKCSTDGEICWTAVQSAPIPTWS